MPISIDLSNPVGPYPVEPMDWNSGKPFDLSKFYPSTQGMLFLARDAGCEHTRYWIDGGLILELETSSINQAFGLFVARPAGTVSQINIIALFDFIECQKNEVQLSGPPGRATLPFVGSIGVVANNADLPSGLSANDSRIGATCVLNFDPEGPVTDPPSAPPSVQRLRLNAPASMYAKPRPDNPFHDYDFLRDHLSPHPPSKTAFRLELSATAGSGPANATAWMRLTPTPAIFPPDGGPSKTVVSKLFKDLNAITCAGVALAITDATSTWLQSSMGPLRARIKSLEVDFG
jgi:hypothetical protein